MKRIPFTAPILALLVFAGGAHAQVLGQYTGAQVLPAGTHLFGGYLDVSSNVVGSDGAAAPELLSAASISASREAPRA